MTVITPQLICVVELRRYPTSCLIGGALGFAGYSHQHLSSNSRVLHPARPTRGLPELRARSERSRLSKPSRLPCNKACERYRSSQAQRVFGVQRRRRCTNGRQLCFQRTDRRFERVLLSFFGSESARTECKGDCRNLRLRSVKSRPECDKRKPAGLQLLFSLPAPVGPSEEQGDNCCCKCTDRRTPPSSFWCPELGDTDHDDRKAATQGERNDYHTKQVFPRSLQDRHFDFPLLASSNFAMHRVSGGA